MKDKARIFILNHFPVIGILVTVVLLFITNYVPGTYLTGWDNLHPEFNFGLNIRQSIFSVWQEHQGLGVLLGMQHATALIYQVFLWLFSFLMPDSLVRYFFTFLMLFTGGTGAYYLIRNIISKLNIPYKKTLAISFIGGLFYLLNLSTIQNFYAPFEAFIAHFAFLPWIVLSVSKFLEKNSAKNALLLSGVFLISSLQAYLPTLFIVTMMAVGLYAVLFVLMERSKESIRKVVYLMAIIFFTNSFWLFPFLYSILFVPETNIGSKINQMVTESIYLRNKEFGDILNVLLLKGFWFKNVDYNIEGIPSIMFTPWAEHLKKIPVLIIGYFLSSITLIGVIYSIKKYLPKMVPMLGLFILGFAMIATNTFPFSTINSLLREIDIFNQIFRFPFTKFSNLASLFFAVFFSLGVLGIINFFEGIREKSGRVFYVVIFASIIILSFPAFRGELFYNRETIKFPGEYSKLFEYFEKQDPNTRIANFPQHSFWGWSFHNWGYGGSGFLWHGIRQPILDRAFDVWSPHNENYYWEMSNALYSKNQAQLEQVINKYNVEWLVVDKSVINPPSPKSIFTKELEDMIKGIPHVKKTEDFGFIEVYKVDPKQKTNNFTYETKSLKRVNEYKWSSFDKVYEQYGDYAAVKSNYEIFYPFRSLLSEKEKINVREEKDFFEFRSAILEDTGKTSLVISSPTENERIIPVNLIAKEVNGEITLHFQFRTPELLIKDDKAKKTNKIWDAGIKHEFVSLPSYLDYPITINVNGITDLKINNKPESGKEINLGSTSLSVSEENQIVITSSSDSYSESISGEDVASWFAQDHSTFNVEFKKGDEIIVRTPKINDGYRNVEIKNSDFKNPSLYKVQNCNPFRSGSNEAKTAKDHLLISSRNSKSCVAILSQSVDHEQGYIIVVDSENVKGLRLNFWVLNEDQNYSPLSTYLSPKKSRGKNTFILAPQEKFGKAYSLHFDNESIGNEETVNKLERVAMFPLPYNFLAGVKIEKDTKEASKFRSTIKVEHPNESLYVLDGVSKDSTIALSQAYDKGWNLYEFSSKPNRIKSYFPFLFSKQNNNHVKVNNWANGWELEKLNTKAVVISYVPQYLQFIGFIFTLITFIFIIVYGKLRDKFA